MVKWTNFRQIKRFVNSMRLYITCEKSGGLHLAEQGLTAGRQAGKQAGIPVFSQGTALATLMHF